MDFSDSLLALAQKYHWKPNIRYVHMDVKHLEPLQNEPQRFDKVLLQGALQCFEDGDLVKLIRDISNILTPHGSVVFGSVPDKVMRSLFYDTLMRRLRGFMYRTLGQDAMGTWWDKDFVKASFEGLGMECTFLTGADSSDQPSAHYRFDVVGRRA